MSGQVVLLLPAFGLEPDTILLSRITHDPRRVPSTLMNNSGPRRAHGAAGGVPVVARRWRIHSRNRRTTVFSSPAWRACCKKPSKSAGVTRGNDWLAAALAYV